MKSRPLPTRLFNWKRNCPRVSPAKCMYDRADTALRCRSESRESLTRQETNVFVVSERINQSMPKFYQSVSSQVSQVNPSVPMLRFK